MKDMRSLKELQVMYDDDDFIVGEDEEIPEELGYIE